MMRKPWGLWTQQNDFSPNLIGGFHGNSVTADVVGATIGGGGSSVFPNRVTDDYGTVGGGSRNRAGDNAGATYDKHYATVGGGEGNVASGRYATVGGGASNTASGDHATVGGGLANEASGNHATISGGNNNFVSGNFATVGGGRENFAKGDYSFVVGRRAANTNTVHSGVFIFADSNDFYFPSTAANQFRVRSIGGAQFVTGIDGSGNPTAGVQVMAGGGSWSSISDRAAKENFADVNEREILARVVALPIQTWNYKSQSPTIRHIGPTAQDFYAAFGVGEDDKHITTVDADGVALAAIQGLYQVVQEKDARIATLERELNALREAQDGGQPVNVSSVIAVAALLVSAVTLYRARKGGQR